MRAILFDVFGTLVDWRSSLIEQFQALERELGGTLPCVELTDRWRQQYKPAMDRVRNGQAPGSTSISCTGRVSRPWPESSAWRWTRPCCNASTGFWHRLRPWPDTLAGMHALKADYWLAALSNGNTALMLDVARHARLPWDMLLCADLFGHYKPDPQVYLGACRLLDLPPQEVMLCAAHNYDLKAARPRPEDRVHRPAAGIRPRPDPGPRRRAGLGPDRQRPAGPAPAAGGLGLTDFLLPALNRSPNPRATARQGKARAAPARVRQELRHVREGYPGHPDRRARSRTNGRSPRWRPLVAPPAGASPAPATWSRWATWTRATGPPTSPAARSWATCCSR